MELGQAPLLEMARVRVEKGSTVFVGFAEEADFPMGFHGLSAIGADAHCGLIGFLFFDFWGNGRSRAIGSIGFTVEACRPMGLHFFATDGTNAAFGGFFLFLAGTLCGSHASLGSSLAADTGFAEEAFFPLRHECTTAD